MGGAVSTGVNNDDLIDNLLEADYIRTAVVEHVFRAVDRGHYFSPEARINAYKDLAWKAGHLHLSAPCIYTEVMEGLNLLPGNSFLNLGSGTGYLSTLAGLLIGSNGVNHGIEIHDDVVQYAYKRLDEFRKLSGALDEFDFCEPKFVVGNCLCLATDLKYDRIYCGAGCPTQYENFLRGLLKIGGILVMPLNDQLIQTKCLSEGNYEVKQLLPVSFAQLVVPDDKQEMCELLTCEPLSLQIMCRAKVRNILRKNIEKENPDSVKRPRHLKRPKRKERILRRLAVPIYDQDSDSDGEQINFGINGRAVIMIREESQEELLRDNPQLVNIPCSNSSSSSDEQMETDASVRFDVHQEIEAIMDLYTEGNRPREKCQSPARSSMSTAAERLATDNTCTDVPGTSKDERKLTPKRTNRIKLDSGLGDEIVEKDMAITSESSDPEHIEVDSSSSSAEENEGKRTKRVKAKIPADVQGGAKWRRVNLPLSNNSSGSDSESLLEEEKDSSNVECRIMVPSPYTHLMAKKIEQLPLPHVLKKYLNYYKEF